MKKRSAQCASLYVAVVVDRSVVILRKEACQGPRAFPFVDDERKRERESRVAGIRAPFANRSRPSRYRPLAPATRDHQFSSSSSSSSPGFDFYLFNFIVPHVIPCHLTRFYLIRPSFSPVLFHFNSVSSRLISLYFPPLFRWRFISLECYFSFVLFSAFRFDLV